mmetsp:Transcript_31272/g.78466  ORF Transcript_31272/g.78466 Transcript_31272/m.78466 type:complete len:525 (-) Transcript_31272:117-1691(-)
MNKQQSAGDLRRVQVVKQDVVQQKCGTEELVTYCVSLGQHMYDPLQEHLERAELCRLAGQFSKKHHALHGAKSSSDLELAASLDERPTTLEDIMASERGYAALVSFMQRCNGPVNGLHFSGEVAKFQTANASVLLGEAKRIFSKYLAQGAPMGVDLPAEMCEKIVPLFQSLSSMQQVHQHTFDAAAAHILASVEKDHLSHFLSSMEYRNWTDELVKLDGSKVNVQSLVNDILRAASARDAFIAFAKQYGRDEDIMFYEDMIRFHDCDEALLGARAGLLYNNYFQQKPVRKINLPPSMVSKARAVFSNDKELKTIGHHTFDFAANEIFDGIKAYLSRFLKSREFQAWMKKHPDSCGALARELKAVAEAMPSTPFDEESEEEVLRGILASPDGKELFRTFLISEYCDENLLFWEAVERFKTLKPQQLGPEARVIYDTFFNDQSEKCLNIPAASMARIKELFQMKCRTDSLNVDKIDATSFNGIQKDVFHLMKINSLMRFVRTKAYTTWKLGGKKDKKKKKLGSFFR